jgi:chromate reductase
MVKLIGFSGSLREGSYNSALLRLAAQVMPPDVEFRIDTIRGIPLYDGDQEAQQGIPPRVAELKDAIAAADGVLIATPEYNNSIPGVLKNAIDWLSRPPDDSARVFGGKKIALIGASPSGFGTILSQNAWLPVFRTLGVRPWYGARVMVARAHKVFDEDGNLLDPAVRQQLRQFLEGFVRYLRE